MLSEDSCSVSTAYNSAAGQNQMKPPNNVKVESVSVLLFHKIEIIMM